MTSDAKETQMQATTEAKQKYHGHCGILEASGPASISHSASAIESTQVRRREVATYTSLDVLLGYCLAMLIFSVSLLFEPLATCHVSFARMF